MEIKRDINGIARMGTAAGAASHLSIQGASGQVKHGSCGSSEKNISITLPILISMHRKNGVGSSRIRKIPKD